MDGPNTVRGSEWFASMEVSVPLLCCASAGNETRRVLRADAQCALCFVYPSALMPTEQPACVVDDIRQ